LLAGKGKKKKNLYSYLQGNVQPKGEKEKKNTSIAQRTGRKRKKTSFENHIKSEKEKKKGKHSLYAQHRKGGKGEIRAFTSRPGNKDILSGSRKRLEKKNQRSAGLGENSSLGPGARGEKKAGFAPQKKKNALHQPKNVAGEKKKNNNMPRIDGKKKKGEESPARRRCQGRKKHCLDSDREKKDDLGPCAWAMFGRKKGGKKKNRACPPLVWEEKKKKKEEMKKRRGKGRRKKFRLQKKRGGKKGGFLEAGLGRQKRRPGKEKKRGSSDSGKKPFCMEGKKKKGKILTSSPSGGRGPFDSGEGREGSIFTGVVHLILN